MMAQATTPERPPKFIGKAPRVYDAVIKRRLGGAAADTLQQIIWCNHYYGHFIEGTWWVRLPHRELSERLENKDSKSTLHRSLHVLKAWGLIKVTKRFNRKPSDRTNWYTVDEARIYQTFWPEPDEPDSEQPRQGVKLTPPCEPATMVDEITSFIDQRLSHDVKLTPPPDSSPEAWCQIDTTPNGGSQATTPRCQFEPGVNLRPLLKILKSREIYIAYSAYGNACEADSASSAQIEPETLADLPEPETPANFISIDLGEEEEWANDDPDEPMFVCCDTDGWLDISDDPDPAPDATPTSEHPDPATCPHINIRYIQKLPDMSFQCLDCGKTVYDPKTRPSGNTQARAAPKSKDKPDWREPARPLACYRTFAPDDRAPLGESDYVARCHEHGVLRAVFDGGGEVVGCKDCDWKPPDEVTPPEGWRESEVPT